MYSCPALTVVSDNGICFCSEELEQFCRANGIKHIKSSPYHSSSNGLAEHAVQTVKAGLKKTNGNLEDLLYTFLARYRVTPLATTGRAPSEFVLQTPLSTRLDLLRPSIHNRVMRKQEGDKERRDQRAVERSFMAGDSVWAMNFLGQPKWVAAMIENRLGPLTFALRLQECGNVPRIICARDDRPSRLKNVYGVKSINFHRSLQNVAYYLVSCKHHHHHHH